MAKLVKSGKVASGTKWVFELNPPMGGATGEAFTNTLASSGMQPAAVLAREAIQNSVDAHRKDQQKVAVDFITRSIVGAGKAAFVKAAGLHAVQGRADKLAFKEPNCLAGLHDPKAPLNLLYVDDHNTTGLEGDPASPESKFSRFLLSLGDGGKEHEEHGTGGSYGFGKSVYSSNSGILTIFAYSRTVDGEGKPMSLLFGCGYFRTHKHSNQYFTGRAWFGHEETTGHAQAQQKVTPLLGEEAEAMAAALGFEPRGADDLGSSVLIVDAMIDPVELLEGVEEWWWPRLISNLLDVKVVDAEGNTQLPRPRKREHLRPFLDAFEIAIGKSPANGKTEFRKPFNKSEGKNVGYLGFKVLQRNEKDEFPVDDSRLDSEALVRTPLMVVAYQRHWMVGSPAMAGAFIAADDIDDILRAAEPPAHDRWDRDARRLQDRTGRKRQIVDKVLNGIRRSLKQCQTTASPPPPSRPNRLTMLERTLARFLTPSKKGSQTGPDPSTAPINLSYEQDPRAEAFGAELRLTASFVVRMKADEDTDTLSVRVRVTCPVVEDGQVGESLNVVLRSDVALVDDPEKPGWQRFELAQKSCVRFVCTTESYDPLWTVRFVPEIEPAEAM